MTYEKKLFNNVWKEWKVYLDHMNDKNDGRTPMDIDRTNQGLFNIFNYYDDHPLTKWDEGQMYNMTFDELVKKVDEKDNFAYDNGLKLDKNGTVEDN